ncbi:flavodoxin reductase [Sphingobacterium sp. ML3W]|uniref:flavodoxin reductase n=1 Tax=Sphingobacterium sp. ML3W TaxID=1538644 RepID=UPI0004F737F1|nr:flavodoxin reductase [Sphingobacterium sp. ML3W]AIM36430.1 flavodoxin reductase [Sphingobacterium sp. ML3W]
MKSILKIREIKHLTHDVLLIQTDRPDSITFQPGQAADIAINLPDWSDQLRPFTFTSLPEDDFLEFTIKTYPSHHAVTEKLLTLVAGDELIVHSVFGSITYKGEGIFIAGGAGITPFIALFRHLEKEGSIGNNKLLFANKTSADIIQNTYFHTLLKDNFINVLSKEQLKGYESGYITTDIIRKQQAADLKYYYLCGPPNMMDAIQKSLETLGVNEKYIVHESF